MFTKLLVLATCSAVVLAQNPVCNGDGCNTDCEGLSCAANCIGGGCGAGCQGMTCAANCQGDGCGKGCNSTNPLTGLGSNCAAQCNGTECGQFCEGDFCANMCKGDGCGDGCTGFKCADACVDSAGNVGPNAENPAARCGCGANGAVNTCIVQPTIAKSKKGKSAKSMKSHSHAAKSAKSMKSHSAKSKKSSKSAKGPKGKAAGLKAKQSQPVPARIEVGAGVALVGMVGVVALVATKVRASVAPEAGAPYLLAGTPTAPTEPLAAATESSPCMV